ncbi:hypothetical protein Ssi03_74600 [Sphaerisporangium siamense]|uniref:Uncharacterized protein n=1 Tax=Sphaerisporangium siamense TaxID=795645 RepID=A0A7W7D8Q7_9ACTN|nr:hypothetical protein [Sphaerisporangium siamense]MBB4702312.1 hypothetical protein [Sphaerisporangium siamense]GII89470.1 hypothetical protein Ssi03_74600 [Sphaerisporangium siamense]
MAERTPPTSDAPTSIFTFGLRSGAALVIDLIRIYGFDIARTIIDMHTEETFDEAELELFSAALYDAVLQIQATREAVAPDDPSAMPAPTATSCGDSSCRICPAVGGQPS